MKKFIFAGVCAAALATPAAAQTTIDPGTIINLVRGIYESARGANSYNNGYNGYNGYNGQQQLPLPYNGYNGGNYYNGYPSLPQNPNPTFPGHGYNPYNGGYNNGDYYNSGFNPGYDTNAYSSLNSPLDLIFTNLQEGSSVPSQFTVNGYTSPHNVVEVQIQPRRGRALRSTTSADAAGRFAVNVDASQVSPNGILAIQAQARDSRGNLGPARNVQVTRR